MTLETPYIFISHSTQDVDQTSLIADGLQTAGLRAWVDVTSIPDGSSWLREIEKGVEACAAVVVVMTANARSSEWVERETLLALQLGKPVFIALMESVPLPLHLINRQSTNFTKRPGHALSRLVTSLKALPPNHPTASTGKRGEVGKAALLPNRNNFFKYLQQMPEGDTCARIAQDLNNWAKTYADAVTFSGRTAPALHAHLWVGPGGLSIFSVRAYAKTPSVEIPIQYFADFPPYEDRTERLALLHELNTLMSARDQFDDERVDKRPNLPIMTALAPDGNLDQFKKILETLVNRLRAGA